MSPSDRSGRSGALRTLAVVAWLLLGVVAGAPAAAASADAGPTGGLEDDDGGLLNETLGATTDTVETTVEGTTGALVTTVDTTTDAVDATTDATTATVDETVDTTTDTVDAATGGATEPVTDGVDETVDSTTDAVDTTTDETTETVDVTVETTDEVANSSLAATAAVTEGDLDGTTGALGDTVDEVGSLTTDRTASLVETTDAVTTDLAEGTGATLSVVTGTTDLATLDGEDGVASGDTLGTTTDLATTLVTAGGTADRAAVTTRAARDVDRMTERTDGVTVPVADRSDVEVADASGGEAAAAADDDGAPDGPLEGVLTSLPAPVDDVSGEDAAAGSLAALLAGAAGVAVRQGSMAGGSGAGTGLAATARAASAPAVHTGQEALSRLARMLAPFRYSRYDDSDPLELETRRAVYDAVRERPGEPITAVSDRADVNLSTARHHVRVLRDEGLVATARVRNCERFYPAGTDDLELAAAMADESTADILDAMVRHEPASVSAIAEDVDRSPSTVTHHLQKLEDDGIVIRERAGRSVENRLSEAARAALDPDTEALDRPHAAELRMDAESDAETEADAEASAGATAD
jgi:DNA-binding transcriptional ArsR family regulator